MSGRQILSGELQRQVVDELRRRASRRGMSKRIAYEADVSQGHVLGVLNGTQRPGIKLAIGLGLLRLTPAHEVPPAPDEDWLKDQLQLELRAD